MRPDENFDDDLDALLEELHDTIRSEEARRAATKKTVAEVYNGLTDEQKLVVNFLIAEAIKEARDSDIIKKQ